MLKCLQNSNTLGFGSIFLSWFLTALWTTVIDSCSMTGARFLKTKTWAQDGQAGVPQQGWAQPHPSSCIPLQALWQTTQMKYSANGCRVMAWSLHYFYLCSCTVSYTTCRSKDKIKLDVPCSRKLGDYFPCLSCGLWSLSWLASVFFYVKSF